MALGVLAVIGAPGWLAFVGLAFLIVVAAWTLPLTWVALVLAALIPWQFYFTLPDSTFTLRGAAIFALVAAARVLVRRPAWQPWMSFAAIFALAALVAATGASNRYLALKGLYDWLPVFASVFVVSHVADSPSVRAKLVVVLIIAGVAQAALGLFQYLLGLDAVLALLRLPISGLFYQPDLLAERLSDLSFNWVIFERAAPFGTFVNGIDYAVFIAAILSLVLGLLRARGTVIARSVLCDEAISNSQVGDCFAQNARNDKVKLIALAACALVLSVALLLTFKGSGLLAVTGGALTVVLLASGKSFGLRLSAQTIAMGLIVLVGGLILALPFSDLIGQRIDFLVQREQGLSGTIGRLGIWAGLLQFFAARPLFGYGLNNAVAIAEPTRTLSGGAFAFVSTTPESAYVAALIEVGAVGFIALMGLFAATLARGYRRVREPFTVGILAALVAIFVGNLTVAGFTTDQNGMLLGILIGMIWESASTNSQRINEYVC
ncbi:MAG: O-antigen ligase family protein [Chloroflexi bacterium]|nr:O-antigen ligase family protein [Chloroflexota bacterium]